MSKEQLEKEFENIMKLFEKENVETIALAGDAGVGKTWMARKINDFIINSESCFYGNLWISMNKKHDKRFLYDVLAHQLSLQASTEDYQEGNDGKKSEELVSNITTKLEQRGIKKSEVFEITKMLTKMELKKLEELVREIPKKLSRIESYRSEALEITEMVREMESKKSDELEREITKKLREMEKEKLQELGLITDEKSGGSDRLSDDKAFPRNDRREDQSKQPAKKSGKTGKKKIKEMTTKTKTVEMIDKKSGGDASSSKVELFLLVILDDIRSDSTYEEETRAELKRLLPKQSKTMLKFLVTIRSDEGRIEKILENKQVIIEIKSLQEKESGTLFKKLLKTSIPNEESFATSIEEIAKKSNGLPIGVVVLVAEALNLSGADDLELSKSENALKEVANNEADKCMTLLLCFAIDMLHGGDHGSWSTPGNDTLVNCYWHSREFVSRHGAIDYNVLIFSWILEGYFGSADHIKQTYEEGHCVLMKLIGCGLLKMLEDNLVMMEELVLPIPDCRRVGYEQRSVLGLARVLDESIWKGFGILAPSDYMMKTPTRGSKQDKYISTLLIHGSRLCRENPDLYFKEKLGLQNLAIFNPRFESFPPLLSKMEELCVLVLRGCDQLQEIDDIKHLKSLTVLEISDADFLERITDDLFKEMTNLQTLNFCAVSIKTLPSSLSNLSQLRWLILRRCPFLEILPNLKAHTNLEVLDLSGSTSLLKITDKNFSHLKKIQFLDFSHTSIKRFPILCNPGKLENLTRLLLRDCKLTRLPSFKALPALQYLDISASNILKEINGDFSENKDKLKILDLSKTEIKRLPSNFGNFPNLELLDLSDASNLVEIPENAFKNMGCLRHLNLSNTKLESLPKISNLVNLRHLFLKNCPLHKLPTMEGVTRLEELHLSNASSLVEIEDESFDHLSHIRHLDFSHTKIKTLPSLANLNNLHSLNLSGTGLTLPSISDLTNLTQLSLRGCSVPDQSEPSFGKLRNLEVLDLSETGITSLPSLKNLTSLRELKLRGCSKLEQLQHLELLAHLEVLDLWETGIKNFPNEIYKLSHLKHLDLPKGIQEFDLQKMERLSEVLNWNECCSLEKWENMRCISVTGTKFLKDLKEKSGLWEQEFKEFHFSVCPEQGRAGDIHWHKFNAFFRRIYFNTLSFDSFRDQVCRFRQYLEIVGFDSFPAGVEDALKKAAYVSLIENKFITRLSDLGVENMDAMKGCWLQRCTEMEKISLGEETEAKMEGNLEILWASNLPKLKHVCSGIQPAGGGFKNLTEMYLDCCPLIKYVFHVSQFPEKLKILQIKFCEDLEELFDWNVLDADKKWGLQKLHLVELPKLTGMGVPKSKKVRDVFPSLLAFKVKECPMLEITLEQIEEAGGRVENSNNVEEHWYEKTPTRSVYGQCSS
ncbi:putative disease resistance protein At4g19050 [Juglans microcarpa x Juglans regia]|uniref:putative disease resistance protein At4g19050 n=1 Tax=Juglans microcarpa x Juglans regia TaxID=2249226 RepID=UPI001B7EB2AA|nr:putative disease resistance protein At4g19050 [Juglans microcarpa x Juglans regia]